MEECYYNKEEEAYKIYIDETLKDNKAGYGVFCKQNSEYNYCNRVEGEQTLQNATHEGILHALKGVPKDQAINFIIDRKARRLQRPYKTSKKGPLGSKKTNV